MPEHSTQETQEHPTRKRLRQPIFLLILSGLLAYIALWQYPSFKKQAEVGVAYAARIGCSCRYVQERDLDACYADFVSGTELVSISENADTKTITGSVPLLASRSARFADASGCLLLDRN